ncbi:hypothetical protein [Sorangium sp. So ce131]|uniref:hypothetical protein n=1 Tax=Sorangium sp. So ce131 TaxID=3133282 RepID=UPI003F6061E9
MTPPLSWEIERAHPDREENMGYGLKLKAGAFVLCGGFVAVLASACDLSYTV